jgi:hypothetical protein
VCGRHIARIRQIFHPILVVDNVRIYGYNRRKLDLTVL